MSSNIKLENISRYTNDVLLKTIIYNDEDNGVYNRCLIHKDFDTLIKHVIDRYIYNDAQYTFLKEAFEKEIKHLN